MIMSLDILKSIYLYLHLILKAFKVSYHMNMYNKMF